MDSRNPAPLPIYPLKPREITGKPIRRANRMHPNARIGLSVHEIRQILIEDQSLFDRTIAAAKQRNSLERVNASQPQPYSNGTCHRGGPRGF